MAKKRIAGTLWKQLAIGDRVRLVEIPSEFFQPGYHMDSGTMRIYRQLLNRRRSLRIW